MYTQKTGISRGPGIHEIPAGREIPELGKFPNLGNFPGIPVREIPGREKFEAIRAGGNGNFPLNIPATWPLVGPLLIWICLLGVPWQLGFSGWMKPVACGRGGVGVYGWKSHLLEPTWN